MDVDNLFVKELNNLSEFSCSLSTFCDKLQKESVHECDILNRHASEYSLWNSILSGEILHIQSSIQSINASMIHLRFDLETKRAKSNFEMQKSFIFETECDKLRHELDEYQMRIRNESLLYHAQYELCIAHSKHFASQIIIPSLIFSNILHFLDFFSILNLELVNSEWYDSINNWRGWHLYQYRNDMNIFNVRDDMNHHHSRMNGMTHPRFRRFILSIETQKNNKYLVEIVGYSDRSAMLSERRQSGIKHDKSKKRLTIESVENDSNFNKEFNICHVILGNHQKLAEIKEACARLRSRCESDKSTQKGYQMQTSNLQREIISVDKYVKQLDLQTESDQNTIQFLHSQIAQLSEKIKNQRLLLKKLVVNAAQKTNVPSESYVDINMQQQVLNAGKEKDLLTKQIKILQSKYRAITQQRDEHKYEYERLKRNITTMAQTQNLL